MRRVLGAVLGLVLCAGATYADHVDLINARGPDGQLNEQARAHQVRYMTWTGVRDRGEEALEARVGVPYHWNRDSALFVSLRAPEPGQYQLTLKRLSVHEGDMRQVAVYVAPEPQPRRVIRRLLDDRDSRDPLDYTMPLQLGADDLHDGRLTLMFRSAAVQGGGMDGLTLSGPNSVDELVFGDLKGLDGKLTATALDHDIRYVMDPIEDNRSRRWNLGPRGAGLGTRAAYGYLQMQLRPQGVGRHLLKLLGVSIPRGVPPRNPVLRVNGQEVGHGDRGNRSTIVTEIDVSPAQYASGTVAVRVDPILEEPVYVQAVSLEPKGELGDLIFPEEADACYVWPVRVFTEFSPGMLPPDPLPAPIIELAGARNEWVHACFSVSNFLKGGPNSLPVRFELSDLVGPRGATLSSSDARLLALQLVWGDRTQQYRTWQALMPGAGVEVPAGETRQMWLATRLPCSARPGSYAGVLTAAWPGGSQQLRVRLRVWNFRLPDQSPLEVCGWLHAPYEVDVAERRQDGAPGLSEKAVGLLQDYRDHYGNVWGTYEADPLHLLVNSQARWDQQGNLTTPLDMSMTRRLASVSRQFGMRRLYILEFGTTWEGFETPSLWEGIRDNPPLVRGTEAFTRAARQVLDAIAEACREGGLDDDGWMVYQYDESLGPEFVKAGEAVRAARPQVRIFSNKSDDLTEMQAAAPYVDIWCVYVYHIETDPDGRRMALMRESGKPVWSYNGSGVRDVPALSVYRWHAWLTFRHAFHGIGMWHYFGDSSGLAIAPEEVGRQPGQDGWWVIWSPRLLAWTDGIEDHMYLTMLQRYADEHAGAGEAESVRELLRQSVTAVLADPGNPDIYARWTTRLGEEIERLRLPVLTVAEP